MKRGFVLLYMKGERPTSSPADRFTLAMVGRRHHAPTMGGRGRHTALRLAARLPHSPARGLARRAAPTRLHLRPPPHLLTLSPTRPPSLSRFWWVLRVGGERVVCEGFPGVRGAAAAAGRDCASPTRWPPPPPSPAARVRRQTRLGWGEGGRRDAADGIQGGDAKPRRGGHDPPSVQEGEWRGRAEDNRKKKTEIKIDKRKINSIQ